MLGNDIQLFKEFGQKEIQNHKNTVVEDYSRLKHEYIKGDDILDNAIGILKTEKENFANRKGSHLADQFSRKQNRCDDAIRCLKRFKQEGFSLEQLDALITAANRQDHLVDHYIADALLKAKKHALLNWKKKFDDYREKKLGWLYEENKLLQGQENSSELANEYKNRVKQYNHVRKEAVALNARIPEFHDFFPKETPVEKLKLPEKLKRLESEAKTSWFSSDTYMDFLELKKEVGGHGTQVGCSIFASQGQFF